MEDLDRLIKEAADRGMGLMFDMVFNHTSTHHQWFAWALKRREGVPGLLHFPEREKGVPPTNWQSKFGGSAWGMWRSWDSITFTYLTGRRRI